MFVFSVCRLVSWRCHNISAIFNGTSALSQNRTCPVKASGSQLSPVYAILPISTSVSDTRLASPCLSSSLPFCVRFNRALPLEIQPYSQAATLDIKPLAKSYLGGNHSHLPSNHFQYARAMLGSLIALYYFAHGTPRGSGSFALFSVSRVSCNHSCSTAEYFVLSFDSSSITHSRTSICNCSNDLS